MNERIKQAAELSKQYKTILVDGRMQSVLLIDPERFAALIVRECANVGLETHGNYDVHDDILKHFGVEE